MLDLKMIPDLNPRLISPIICTFLMYNRTVERDHSYWQVLLKSMTFVLYGDTVSFTKGPLSLIKLGVLSMVSPIILPLMTLAQHSIQLSIEKLQFYYYSPQSIVNTHIIVGSSETADWFFSFLTLIRVKPKDFKFLFSSFFIPPFRILLPKENVIITIKKYNT